MKISDPETWRGIEKGDLEGRFLHVDLCAPPRLSSVVDVQGGSFNEIGFVVLVIDKPIYIKPFTDKCTAEIQMKGIRVEKRKFRNYWKIIRLKHLLEIETLDYRNRGRVKVILVYV